jgi:hypothetical protein
MTSSAHACATEAGGPGSSARRRKHLWRERLTVIGVLCHGRERAVVREFFELFKVPWDFVREDASFDVVVVTTGATPPDLGARLVIAFDPRPAAANARNGGRAGQRTAGVLDADGLRLPLFTEHASVRERGAPRAYDAERQPLVREERSRDAIVLRCGYGLFAEVEFLLSRGQPGEHGPTPTLDLHIELLRRWIVAADVPLVEIPPQPPGHPFIACLTHDIDFLGLRRHVLDRTLAGFLARATTGSLLDLLRGRRSLRQVLRNWAAVLSLPLVHAGLVRDPWRPFEQYPDVERELRSTYFVVPFRGRPGRALAGTADRRRAVGYDAREARLALRALHARGFEVALHGVDAWTDVPTGRAEREVIAEIVGGDVAGVRMHWLYLDDGSFAKLDAAGFAYDATVGYNDAVGFRAGTAQAFRPLSARNLLELPLHIQDTALFFPARMHLRDRAARVACGQVIARVAQLGGVLTISWHDRSLAPERQWDGLYRELLEDLRRRRAWVRPAREVVKFFAERRSVSLQGVDADAARLREVHALSRTGGDDAGAQLLLRLHRPPDGPRSRAGHEDVPLTPRALRTLRGEALPAV